MTLPKLSLRELDTVPHRRRVAESINNIVSFEYDDSRVRTRAEKAAGVIPVNPAYQPGDVRRYGADPTGSLDSTKAIQDCLDANDSIYVPAGSYLFTGLTLNNYNEIIGDGAKRSVLLYTPSTGNGINLGTGLVQNIRGIKIYAVNDSTGYALRSNTDVYVSDFTIDLYEIEGFLSGIYIPFGLQILIGRGRLLGPGTAGTNPTWDHTHVANSIGIQLGNREVTGALGVQLVNVGKIAGAYPALFETAVIMDGDIMEIDNSTLEFCDTCVETTAQLFVHGSWLQAETNLFKTRAGGWEINATGNKYFNGSYVGQDDPAAMSTLATSNEELGVTAKSEFKGAGRFRYRFATSKARGVQFGASAADSPVLYEKAEGNLCIESTGRPLELDRDSAGAVTIFGLRQQGTMRGFLGVDTDAYPALVGHGGASFSLRWDNLGNLFTGSGALATTATDGFSYVPTCAGTPTGVPSGKTGFSPVVIDTTNNRLYFYSGGAWRNAGP